MFRGRSKPKRPLNAKPRTAAQQSQGASVEIRILRRRTGRGNITASGQRRNWPRPDYRRCCSHDSPVMSATHVQRSAQGQRGPLPQNLASPCGKARGSAARSASSSGSQDAEASLQAAGAPGLPALLSVGQPRNERHPCRGRPKPKRPLNAKPGIAAQQGQGGQRRNPHPPAQGKTREHRCQWPGARTTSVAVRRAASE